MLVTSSDSFKWGEGAPHQLGKDSEQAMGPQTQWGWGDLGRTNATISNS